MTELISLPEANHIMLVVLFAAPLAGAAWGLAAKQIARGLIYGTIIGVGNFAMWTIYNAITNRLGLDTVKNLLINLALFVIVGVVAGVLIGRFDKGPAQSKTTQSAD